MYCICSYIVLRVDDCPTRRVRNRHWAVGTTKLNKNFKINTTFLFFKNSFNSDTRHGFLQFLLSITDFTSWALMSQTFRNFLNWILYTDFIKKFSLICYPSWIVVICYPSWIVVICYPSWVVVIFSKF